MPIIVLVNTHNSKACCVLCLSCAVLTVVFVNDFSAAEKILSRDSSLVNPTKQDVVTPLHVAAAGGHVDVANVLIKVAVIFNLDELCLMFVFC